MPNEPAADYKELILKTLFSILERKSSRKVTVTELMQEAGLNRRLFYHYFFDIDDAIYSDFKDYCLEAFQSYTRQQEWEPAFIGSAAHIKAFYRYYKNVVRMEGTNSFEAQYERMMIDMSYSCIGTHHANEELDFMLRLYWHGAAHALVNWIKNDAGVPIETLARYLHNSMPKGMKEYFP